ncbi:flagellar biosynthesis protein FlhB [Pseudomonas profundi]|uniref:flagellar biosynthesis protein FlhB n=1 Tax=Pseudomonas profundi TaxID=1981513 RepID=UPI00123905AC|nr:flagellar biosynthesis protein FlhB [Pseudomonas profundi]
MAEDKQSSQEKTEQPTEQKLKKSRADGQVARSKDLATTVSLLATLVVLKFNFGLFFEGLQDLFRISYVDFHRSEITQHDLTLVLGHNLLIYIKLMLPLLITTALVVVFSMVPGGWVFSSKNFSPKLSKLNPITGIGRIFSGQNWAELFKSVLKITVLLATAAMLLLAAAPQFVALQKGDVFTAISGAMTLAYYIAIMLVLVFVLFSFIDIPLQKYFFTKKMRMTKQEIKEEHKNQEGRPEVKARIKQLQRQLSQRQISKVMKDADVVIVNPQHYAVALRYDLKKAEAPFVVAKGIDETAQYIRKTATAYNLDVIEVPPLARAVYYSTQVNQQIPAPLYTAVAHILTYVLQLKAWRAGRRPKPELASQLPIPASMIR